MRPTRRGVVVVAIAALALIQGALFGQRSLNYVAAPAVVALVIGAVTLWRAETPTVERTAVRPGFSGERRSETISIDGGGVATVIDGLPDGIDGEMVERTGAVPFETERELVLRDRGQYTLGPATIRQRDPLGVIAATHRLEHRNEVVVYPEVYDLSRTDVITALFGEDPTTGSELFDWLREYQEGDPLQRIDWKQTARHDELLVVGSEPNRQHGSIRVAVDGRGGDADDVSAAAASLVVLFFDAGFDVSVTVRDGRGVDISEERRLDSILYSLAGLGDGPTRRRNETRGAVDSRDEPADVSVRGTEGTVVVRLDDGEFAFERLRSDPTGSSLESRRKSRRQRAVIDG